MKYLDNKNIKKNEIQIGLIGFGLLGKLIYNSIISLNSIKIYKTVINER